MRRSLVIKISAAILLLEILVLSILGVYYVNRFGRELEARAILSMQIPGKLIATQALNYSAVRNVSALGELIGQRIESSMLIRRDGRVFYASDSDSEGQPSTAILGDEIAGKLGPSMDDFTLRLQYNQRPHIAYVASIRENGNLLGYLYLLVDTSQLAEEKNQLALMFVLSSLLCVLCTTITEVLLVRRLITPRVHQTLTCLKEVESGSLNARITGDLSADEIGELQRGVNSMVAEIETQADKLHASNGQLRLEIRERQSAEAEQKRLYERLVELSRHAGMSEVATGTLHNVGNVLNSILVSAVSIESIIDTSHTSGVIKALELMEQNRDRLADFLAHDKRGKLLPDYFRKLCKHLADRHRQAHSEIAQLKNFIDHAASIIQTQQSYSRDGASYEVASLPSVVKDAILISSASLKKRHINIDFSSDTFEDFALDKHKIIQIVVNLLENAKDAITLSGRPDGNIAVSVERYDDTAMIFIHDNGVGLSDETAERIFEYGFTTKSTGHGFGLHSARVSAEEMQGTLTVESAGPNQGAIFTLTIPI